MKKRRLWSKMSKPLFRIFYQITCVLLSFVISIGYANSTQSLQSGVNQMLIRAKRKGMDNFHMGVQIQSLSNHQIIYQYHANYLFTPASVEKLFTAVAALKYLSPNFRFSTKLLSTGKIENGVLQGNLTVKFSGDPELTSAQLDDLFKQLAAKGIHKIAGSVYVDGTELNSAPDSPGCLPEDLKYAYAAPVTAIIINQNRFGLRLIPATRNEAKPIVQTSLPVGSVNIVNEAVTTFHSHTPHCTPLKISINNKNEYVISGCLNRRSGQQAETLANRDPALYARVLIKQLLIQNQIEYEGHVVMHAAEPGAAVLAVHDSNPLFLIIKEMLKKSDNLRTHAVFRKLGQVYFKTQGTWQNSLAAMKAILAHSGVDFSRIHVVDGAGLSMDNQVSPAQLTQLLDYAYHQPEIRQYLLPALPIGGKDGTLRSRMSKEGKSERIRAKTGSMKGMGVSALAGYIATKHHGMISFAIIVNNIKGGRWPYLILEDHLCEFLVNAP
jgi:D-alanyl-D-alanine carboxypeptidase/D-alanyl-D-alanine-endopeptidase (penicillin-binding protein 4)